MILLLDWRSRRRLTPAMRPEPIAAAEVEPFEVREQELVVECQRPGEIRAARERDQPDAVGGALEDELLHRVLREREAIDALPARVGEVLRLHAAREVHGDDDVNAAGRNLRLALAKLRSREREEEQRQRQPPQRAEEGSGPRLNLASQPAHELHGRVEEGRLEVAPALEPRQQRQQEQQEQQPGMGEGESHGSAECGMRNAEWVGRANERARRGESERVRRSGGPSPSPRPSPSGRGRKSASARSALASLSAGSGVRSSLSRRERAGVRGKGVVRGFALWSRRRAHRVRAPL
jgi:hypothetical protein